MTITQHDPEPEQLPLIRSDEFLPPISRWTKLGGLFLLGAVGTTLALAASIHYNVTVKASAVVRPTGDLRVVQAATSGTIVSISVQPNQAVKAGDAIASIDNAELQNKKNQLLESIQQGQAELAQINAQIGALNTQIIAESNLRDRSVAAAQAQLSRVIREYQDQQITTQAEAAEAEAAVKQASEERDRYRQLAGSGAIADLQVSEKEHAFEVAAARLDRARAALNPTQAAIATAQEQIAQEQAKGAATLATLNRTRQELVQRQIQVQTQMSRDQADLKQTQITLSKNIIRATVDGIILNLNLRNPGQVVQSGEAIAQIAPKNIPYVVIGYVDDQDIGKVAVGQTVDMRIAAYPYPDYGILKGTITAIAPDATVPQPNNGAANTGESAPSGKTVGMRYYEVTIRPQKPYLVKAGRPYHLQSGMEARADIISRDETVLTFVLRKARLIADL